MTTARRVTAKRKLLMWGVVGVIGLVMAGALGPFMPPHLRSASGFLTLIPFWSEADIQCPTCGLTNASAPGAHSTGGAWKSAGGHGSSLVWVSDFELAPGSTGDTAGQPGGSGHPTNYFMLASTGDTGSYGASSGGSSGGSSGSGGSSSPAGSGQSPGLTPGNPLMPTNSGPSKQFSFPVQNANQPIFIDPELAVGYDYVVGTGPNIATAIFSPVPGDTDGYDVFGFNPATGKYDIPLGHAAAGVPFDFGPGGTDRFGLRGIDGGLNPEDAAAFVTGLTFVAPGNVSLTQTAFTAFFVPVPGTLPLVALGLLCAGLWTRGSRGRRLHAQAAL